MTLSEKLKQIEERASAALPGPWEACPGDSSILVAPSVLHPNLKAEIGSFFRFRNEAVFTAHARTDIPLLLALVRKAIEQRDKWIEWEKGACDCFKHSMDAELLALCGEGVGE